MNYQKLLCCYFHTRRIRKPDIAVSAIRSAISLQEFKISVERSRAAGVTQERTKTKSGRRLIDLRQGAHDALIAQMQHTYLAGDLVFQDPATLRGSNNADRLSEAWRNALRRAEVRHRNLYQTRHTFASTLLSSGANLLYVRNKWVIGTRRWSFGRTVAGWRRWHVASAVHQGEGHQASKNWLNFRPGFAHVYLSTPGSRINAGLSDLKRRYTGTGIDCLQLPKSTPGRGPPLALCCKLPRMWQCVYFFLIGI